MTRTGGRQASVHETGPIACCPVPLKGSSHRGYPLRLASRRAQALSPLYEYRLAGRGTTKTGYATPNVIPAVP